MNMTVWIGIHVDDIEHIDESMQNFLEGNGIMTIGVTVLETLTADGHTIGYGWVARQDLVIDAKAAIQEYGDKISVIRELLNDRGITGDVRLRIEKADPCHIEMWRAAQRNNITIH